MGFSSNIQEYDLLSPIGGVDDISFMYLSRYNPTKEYVALVYTDLTISQDIEFIDELTATIRNTKLLKHPNIMPMLTSFVENERLWVVTKPVHAGSFHGLLKNHFPHGLPEPAVATVIKEVLKALVYLHKGCHIHNDIRAENILLTGNGEVQISGFHQLISLLQQGKYRSSVFDFVGEIEWMAPEIIVQHANHDSKIDIYSLGITALQLAYGKTPFDEWPPLKVLLCKLEHECPIYLSQDKDLSKSFFSMVSLCLQRNPGLRPSACELLEHSFFKQAKNEAFLKSCIVDRCGIMAKHASDAAKIRSQQQQPV